MSQDDVKEGVKITTKGILVVMAIGMVSFFSTLVFNTTMDNRERVIENRLSQEPLVAAVENLTLVTNQLNFDANNRADIMFEANNAHKTAFIKAMNLMTVRMERNEQKLFRVIDDCADNHKKIGQCMRIQFSAHGMVGNIPYQPIIKKDK